MATKRATKDLSDTAAPHGEYGDDAGSTAHPPALSVVTSHAAVAANEPASDAADDGVDHELVPALQSEADILTSEVALAQQAGDALDLKLDTVADASSAAAEKRPARKPLTPKERIALNAKRKQEGLDLLKRKAVGVAHVLVEVNITHKKLSDLFLRTYPIANMALTSFNRSGGYLFGSKAAQTVADQIDQQIRALSKFADDGFAKARLLIDSAKAGGVNADDIKLVYKEAFGQTVEITAPQSRALLHAFVKIDGMLREYDTIVWSGIRPAHEVEREFNDVNQKIRLFAAFVIRTLISQSRRSNEVFNRRRDATPAAATAIVAAAA
jgi:hypothetical protein